MSPPPTDLRLADLLAQRAWVRTLARSLVRDEALADDLEQETWLAALERPPTWHTSPRGWLGAVLRNRLARSGRGGARRARRERAAAQPEALRATDDVMAQAEQHKLVVDAVWGLEEATRTAVLLRYFEGLPPRVIAERTGAPVETVRARVRRGVEQMRARLDERHGGERRTWIAGLAPLLSAGLPTSAGSAALGGTAAAAGEASLGGTLMAGKGMVGVGLAAVLAVGAWWISRPDGSALEEAPTGPAARTPEAPGARGGGPTPTLAGTPSGAPRSTPVIEPASPAALPRPTGPGLLVRMATSGLPPADPARVFVPGPTPLEATSDVRGWVALPQAPDRAVVLWVTAPGARPARREGLELASGTAVVDLEPGAGQRLAFVDLGGRALPGAEVQRRYEQAGEAFAPAWLWPEAVAPGSAKDVLRGLLEGPDRWRLLTSAGSWGEGGASLTDAMPVPGVRIVVPTPSGVVWLSPPLQEGQALTVPIGVTHTLSLRLLAGDSGEPLSGARVTAFTEFGDDALFLPGRVRLADREGRVALDVPEWAAQGRAPSVLVETESHVLWCVQGLRRLRSAGSDPVELRVPRVAALSGHAFAAGGQPAAGAQVVWANRGLQRRGVVAPDGSYRLDRVAPWQGSAPPGATASALVALVDPATLEALTWAQAEVRPGEVATLDLGRAAGTSDHAGVAGRVFTGSQPLGGVLVALRSRAQRGDDKRGFATSAADGAFALEGLVPGDYDLLVLLGNPRVSDDYVLRLAAPLTLTAGERRSIDVRLPAGTLRIRILDEATGQPVPQAMVVAEPERKEAARGAVEGFEGALGGSAFADAEGRAVLGALLPGEPHRVRAAAEGYAEGAAPTAVPSTDAGSSEVLVKLKRR